MVATINNDPPVWHGGDVGGGALFMLDVVGYHVGCLVPFVCFVEVAFIRLRFWRWNF
jgi:hypothetical protein